MLPLARRNVLASTVRVSALSAQRPRWYAKGKDSTPYTLPESLQAKEPQPKKPKAAKNQTPAEQPESESQAKPETEAAESPIAVSYRSQITHHEVEELILLTNYST